MDFNHIQTILLFWGGILTFGMILLTRLVLIAIDQIKLILDAWNRVSREVEYNRRTMRQIHQKVDTIANGGSNHSNSSTGDVGGSDIQ